MSEFPVSAAVLGDSEALRNHKRKVFERMEIRDRLGKRSAYTPHKHQEKAHFPRGKVTHAILACGRRGGKSKFAEAEALAMMGIEGTATWIGAPTYALTDRVFQPLYRSIVIDKVFGVSPVRERNNPSHRYIEMPWGAILEGKSAEKPASSKGASLDLFIDDECAEHDESYYTEYVGPGLADRQGKAIFTSTPLGLTWFHDYFKRGKDKEFQPMGWRSYTWKSSDNPYLDKKWLKQQRAVVSDHVWRQEYCAEFLTRSGMIWEDYKDEYMDGPGRGGHLFSPDRVRIPAVWPRVRGIDIGTNHPTACVWVAIDPQHNLWVYQEYLAKAPLHQQHAQAIASQTSDPITSTLISWEADSGDGKGGETVRQIYQQSGVYCNLAPRDWLMRKEAVAMYFRSALQDSTRHPAMYISDRCTRLRHQILKYRYKDLKPGAEAGTPKPHRKGVNDDLCDALGHAVVSKPRYVPDWMDSAEDGFLDRYGYQDSAFVNRNAGPGVVGIRGLATVPGVPSWR